MLRYAVRTLLRRPALSIAAVVTIAVGAGVNAAVFSLIRAVLLRPLPFRDPGRVVHIWQTHPTLGNLQVSWPDYADWKRARSFEACETYTFQAMNKVTLLGAGAPEQLQATMASAGLLPMLGVALVRGRGFTPSEEAGKRNVALISETLWRNRFGSDPNITGRVIRVDPLALTVIGVVKQSQAFPVWADIWLPISMLETQLQETRRFHPLEVVARLKPGVTVVEAQAEMAAIAGANATAHPATNGTMGAFVMPLAERITGPVRPALLIVWMAAGLILLMACANVAHLLLTRTVSRARELAIRVSLGAAWTDIAKLLGVESLLLVCVGGGAGVLAAAALLPYLRDMAQARIPRIDEIGFDRAVFLYAIVAAILTVAAILLPSLIRTFDRGPTAVRRGARLGPALLVSEIALAFVVLTSALLLTRGFAALLAVDPGFDGRDVLALDVSLPPDDSGWESSAKLFENRLAPAIRALPGVTAVAAANMAPMTLDRTETMRYATRFGLPGVSYPEGAYPVAQNRWISEDYFRVMRIPVVRGRSLTQADRSKSVHVINETLARQFFPGQNPVGRELNTGVGTAQPVSGTIVGVVGDVRDLGLDAPPRPTLYSIATSPRIALLVRVEGNPQALAPALRDIVREVAPDAPVSSGQPVSTLVDASLGRLRFILTLMAAFAVVAALLAVVGIYGVASYSVSRRLRELGIRAAIGASPRRLMFQVLWEGLCVSAAGITAGLLLFVSTARLFRTVLYQIPSTDVMSLAGAAILVAALSVTALAVPARRAAGVSPAVALREG